MRRHLLFLMTSFCLAGPVLAANSWTDEQSPAMKQCIQECRQEKDAASRETCDIKCARADEARRKRENETSTNHDRGSRN